MLLAAVLLVHIVLFARMWTRLPAQPELGNIDFISFYTAGRIAGSAGYTRLYDLDLQRSIQQEILHAGTALGAMLPYMHPPFLVPLLQLVTDSDYPGSYIRWSAVLLLAAVLCFVVVFRFLRRDNRFAISDCILTAAASVLFFPVFISLLKGQDTAFMLLGTLIWMGAVLRQNDRLAGASLILVALKPHIALVLAIPTLLVRRRALRSFCLTASLAALVGLLLVHWQGLHDFVSLMRITAQGQGYGVNQDKMYNFLGLMLRSVPRAEPATIRLLAWGLFLLATGALCWCYRKRTQLRESDLGLIVLLGLFTSPHLHFHDLSLLVVPALGLASTAAGDRSLGQAAAPAVLVVTSSIFLFAMLIPGPYCYTGAYLIMLLFGSGLWLFPRPVR